MCFILGSLHRFQIHYALYWFMVSYAMNKEVTKEKVKKNQNRASTNYCLPFSVFFLSLVVCSWISLWCKITFFWCWSSVWIVSLALFLPSTQLDWPPGVGHFLSHRLSQSFATYPSTLYFLVNWQMWSHEN